MEGGDWEHSLESGGVERSGGMRVVVVGRGMVTGAELWSSDIVIVWSRSLVATNVLFLGLNF